MRMPDNGTAVAVTRRWHGGSAMVMMKWSKRDMVVARRCWLRRKRKGEIIKKQEREKGGEGEGGRGTNDENCGGGDDSGDDGDDNDEFTKMGLRKFKKKK